MAKSKSKSAKSGASDPFKPFRVKGKFRLGDYDPESTPFARGDDAAQRARLDALAAKQREADKTAAKLEKERQFNRKVAINADLRRLQTEVEALRR